MGGSGSGHGGPAIDEPAVLLPVLQFVLEP